MRGFLFGIWDFRLRISGYTYVLNYTKIFSPLETMSQFAEPVIPDESADGGRDPESSGSAI